MRLPRFEYNKPSTLDECLELLQQNGAQARLLAGGTDLLVNMKYRVVCPELVLGITGVNELRRIVPDERGYLSIGASVTLTEMLAGTIDVEDAAIATSGDYERFFEYRGRRYHHLLDPGTAAPRVSAVHSVTIRAASCLDADAAATAVFGLDPRGTKELLRAAGGRAELVESE